MFSLVKNQYFVVIAFKIVKDGIQVQVYNINNESVTYFSQFISVKAEKDLRKSQASISGKVKQIEARAK